MKTVTFTSHYNQAKINVRISDDKAIKLVNNSEPFELYIEDCDRVNYGMGEPKYFSKGQIKKLQNALCGIDYWGSLEVVNA